MAIGEIFVEANGLQSVGRGARIQRLRRAGRVRAVRVRQRQSRVGQRTGGIDFRGTREQCHARIEAIGLGLSISSLPSRYSS